MIKALIFDCFGVVVTDTWIAFRDSHFGDNPAKLQEARDASRGLDLGLISRDDFHKIISRLSGVPSVDVYTMLDANSVLDTRVMECIRHYKQHYKISMLSNISPGRLENFLSDDDKVLFDDFALSYSTGVVKPDPNAYYTAAERLRVLPSECVFIDDQERNITPAQEVGMSTIHYTDFAQFERELKELLQ